ncbi:MAG: hypothetical protein U5O39_12895 [Gammaproteobacteria bacterium]|nr:hypothetical protein [Gammaproteobacteria bacterium]
MFAGADSPGGRRASGEILSSDAGDIQSPGASTQSKNIVSERILEMPKETRFDGGRSKACAQVIDGVSR